MTSIIDFMVSLSVHIYVLKEFPFTIIEFPIKEEYVNMLSWSEGWFNQHFILFFSYNTVGFCYGSLSVCDSFYHLNEILRYSPILVFDFQISAWFSVIYTFLAIVPNITISRTLVPYGLIFDLSFFLNYPFLSILLINVMRFSILLVCGIYFLLQLQFICRKIIVPYLGLFYKFLYRHTFRIFKLICKFLREFKISIYLRFLTFLITLYTIFTALY